MKKIHTLEVPLTVPKVMHKTYIQNYLKATSNSDNLFLFAGDQKIEHLNEDFYGKGLPDEINDPEHLFKIASSAKIGAFATQLGLISRYGNRYKEVNYLVKLNSKTNLITTKQADPESLLLWSVNDVVKFKKQSGLSIVGVGYTLYIGSEYESIMLSQAAQAVFNAHQNGLLAILWIYPRGKAVAEEKAFSIVSGAAGVGLCLGADFIKINQPNAEDGKTPYELLSIITQAAGNSKVICSGGKIKNEKEFLEDIRNQVKIGGCAGVAIGRNIHQRTFKEALKLCNEISKILSK